MSDYEHTVFISYAWGSEREDIVNQIDETLQARGINIVRDKRDLGYKGSIKEFMELIGQGNCVIVVISDKYLRSPNCMFELVEIAENKQFHDRVFPIVLSDANIYDPIKRIEYVKHWEAKRAELARAMRKLDPANLQGIRDDMDQYDRIRDKISGLTSILKDMNTLTPEMHRDSDFNDIYTAIMEHMAGSPVVSTAGSDLMAKKKVEEEADRETSAEAERKVKEKAKPTEKEETLSAAPAQKKPVSMGIIIGGAAFAILAIVMAISLANGKNSPTASIETQPSTSVPIETQPLISAPIETQLSTSAPTEAANISTPEPTSIPITPTPEPQPFFIDEFNGDLSHWSSFVTSGDDNRMNIHADNGKMVFELNDANSDLYAYYIFDDFTYTDVQLDAVALNKGVNENNISLICRYSDSGWYEFNIANNGLYWIYAYDTKGVVAKGYNELFTGGSSAIKPGQATNTYTAVCKGNKLSLSINGTPIRTVTETQFNYAEGKIGLSVSSFTVMPVNVQFESLEISKP